MYVWLTDERGYPSGAAGGLVVEGHPEYENRGIIRISQTGSGILNTTMQLPGDIDFFRATLSPVINGSPDFGHAAEVTIISNEDRKSTRLNYSHYCESRMPSSA